MIRKLACLVAVLTPVALLAPAVIAAAEPDHAEILHPYLTPGTAVVGHLNASKLDAPAMFETMRKWTGQPADQTAPQERVFAEKLEAFKAAGGKHIYMLLDLADVPFGSPLLLVPLEGANEHKLTELAKSLGLSTAKREEVLLVGKPDQLKRPPADMPRQARLVDAFIAAGDTAVQAIVIPSDDHRRAAEELMPKLPKELGGGDAKKLVRGIEWVAIGANAPPKLRVTATIGTNSPQVAANIGDTIKTVLTSLAAQAEAGKAEPEIVKMLKSVTPKVDGDRLTLAVNDQRSNGVSLETLLIPALSQSRRKAQQSQSINNLKQIALAMHMHMDQHRTLPPAFTAKNGKPLLSWRVAILPYIEQAEMHKQFHLDEPWDSEHNRQFIARMPQIYRSPASKAAASKTVYLVPRGDETMFPGTEGVKLPDVRDGLSYTLMVVAVSDDQAVEWTRPDDWQFSPENPTKGLGGHFEGMFEAAMGDGSVRMLKLNMDQKVLKALFTRNGGEQVGAF
jgi:hypothetical protein